MSVNKVILLGNVGKDPEINYYDANKLRAAFTLATTERGYVLPNGQAVPDRTEWHSIVAWGQLAKLAENYIRKGMRLYVEGKLRNTSWDDQSGVRHYKIEIQADVIEILTPRSDNQQPEQDTNMPPF